MHKIDCIKEIGRNETLTSLMLTTTSFISSRRDVILSCSLLLTDITIRHREARGLFSMGCRQSRSLRIPEETKIIIPIMK
jgi:hypothetical protein